MGVTSPGRILTINAGSSTLKLTVLGPGDEVVTSADLPALSGSVAADAATLSARLTDLGPVDGVGHRIVHGGMRYRGPVLVSPEVRRQLTDLTDLAPLHQPKSLAALDAVDEILPAVPAVACFDTAFHTTIPDAAATYPLPSQWRERWTLRRFGFHGLSHSYASRRAAELLRAPGDGHRGGPSAPARVVTCHLGAGASLAAVRDGRCVDTTMGFTPLDGLVMATRSGAVDPGLVLWLEEHAGIESAEIATTLEHRSGLLGLTGTADMREVLSRAAAGDKSAALGRDVYLHRLRGLIAAMAASLDGLDALVFTGGVGEHSPEIRSRAAGGLGFLGVRLDEARNAATPDADDYEIGAAGAPARTFVIAAREDRQIAAETRAVLSHRGLSPHPGASRWQPGRPAGRPATGPAAIAGWASCHVGGLPRARRSTAGPAFYRRPGGLPQAGRSTACRRAQRRPAAAPRRGRLRTTGRECRGRQPRQSGRKLAAAAAGRPGRRRARPGPGCGRRPPRCGARRAARGPASAGRARSRRRPGPPAAG
jgi:acetate kinase